MQKAIHQRRSLLIACVQIRKDKTEERLDWFPAKSDGYYRSGILEEMGYPRNNSRESLTSTWSRKQYWGKTPLAAKLRQIIQILEPDIMAMAQMKCK